MDAVAECCPHFFVLLLVLVLECFVGLLFDPLVGLSPRWRAADQKRARSKLAATAQYSNTPQLHFSNTPPLLLSVLPWARSAVDHPTIRCSVIPS